MKKEQDRTAYTCSPEYDRSACGGLSLRHLL